MNPKITELKEDIAILQEKLYKLEEIEKRKAIPRMNLENEGKFDIVTYNNDIFYRLEYLTGIIWCKRRYKCASDEMQLINITDQETFRLLDGVWYNDVQVKREKKGFQPSTQSLEEVEDDKYQEVRKEYEETQTKKEDTVWKSVALRFGEILSDIGPCNYYKMTANEWFKWAKDTYEKNADELLKLILRKNKAKEYQPTPQEPEENEWRDVALKYGRKLPVILPYGYDELSPNAWFRWVVFTYDNYMNQRDKESGYCPTPQTPEETAESLRAAMRQANEDGVFDNVENQTNYKPSMFNCILDGNPPNGYSYWNEWYKELGSKGILHDLKISSIGNVKDNSKPMNEVVDRLEDKYKQAEDNSNTLYNLIDRWWGDILGIHSDWDMQTSIEDLCDRIELWNMRNKK